jgi:predicted RNase H-like HicB family nuclease
MDYTVVLHPDETSGFWVEVPALPGCTSQGESVEECLENVKEAIELFIEGLREQGTDIPRDDQVVFRVTVAA